MPRSGFKRGDRRGIIARLEYIALRILMPKSYLVQITYYAVVINKDPRPPRRSAGTGTITLLAETRTPSIGSLRRCAPRARFERAGKWVVVGERFSDRPARDPST